MQKNEKTILKVENLKKHFKTADGYLDVLTGVDLEVKKGKFVSVVGESGVGKSTLMHILGLIDPPTSGDLEINDLKCFELEDEELTEYRNERIGFVFQFHHLLPEFTALENVTLPQLIARKPPKEAQERAYKLLSSVGLEERADHYPNQLSGGEQQRVAFSRALSNDPEVVIADEPTGNLDERNSQIFIDLILDLQDNFNKTFILATHDLSFASYTQRIMRLHNGRVHEITSEVQEKYGRA